MHIFFLIIIFWSFLIGQFNSTSDKEDDDMDKKMHQDGDDDGGLTEDDSGDMIPANGREVVMSVMMPRKIDENGSTPVTEHQIIWVPASVPQPPPLYSIKQLNYAQVNLQTIFYGISTLK